MPTAPQITCTQHDAAATRMRWVRQLLAQGPATQRREAAA